MQDVLLSDVLSSDEDIRDDLDATERSELSSVEKKDAYVRKLLKEHAYARRCRRKFQKFSAQVGLPFVESPRSLARSLATFCLIIYPLSV